MLSHDELIKLGRDTYSAVVAKQTPFKRTLDQIRKERRNEGKSIKKFTALAKAALGHVFVHLVSRARVEDVERWKGRRVFSMDGASHRGAPASLARSLTRCVAGKSRLAPPVYKGAFSSRLSHSPRLWAYADEEASLQVTTSSRTSTSRGTTLPPSTSSSMSTASRPTRRCTSSSTDPARQTRSPPEKPPSSTSTGSSRTRTSRHSSRRGSRRTRTTPRSRPSSPDGDRQRRLPSG